MTIFASLMPEQTFWKQFNPAHLEVLEKLAGAENVMHFKSLEALESHPNSAQISIILTGWGAPYLSRSILRHCPKLKLVAHCAGSLRAVFDPSLFEHGVRSTNSAVANAVPVAEFLLSWVLRWNKQLPYWESAYRDLTVYNERSAAPPSTIGNRNKTVGIISASKVGRRFAELLQHFELNVLIYDPVLTEKQIASYGAKKTDLFELLKESDIVSINTPLLPETQNMIATNELALMRDGCLLINTARGAVLDHSALLPELQSGRLSAVLDVTEPEPLPGDSPFFDLPNAFITPHIAGSMGTEVYRLTENTLNEIACFVRDGQLHHEVSASNWETVA